MSDQVSDYVIEEMTAVAPDFDATSSAAEKRIFRGGVIGWIVALAYLALCGILYGLT